MNAIFRFFARIAAFLRSMFASKPKSLAARTRDWVINFGPMYGEAGKTIEISSYPELLFRGEKIMANDSSTSPGCGTRIKKILVGQERQAPSSDEGTLTVFFGPSALGNGIKLSACSPPLSVTMVVQFIESCTFDAAIFGRAIL